MTPAAKFSTSASDFSARRLTASLPPGVLQVEHEAALVAVEAREVAAEGALRDRRR